MPRKPPSALRSGGSRSPGRTSRKHIRGLSAKAQGAIRRLEDQHFWSDAIADALHAYGSFLQTAGRYIYVNQDCPFCDPVEARDRLEEALRALPAAARSELRVVVERLDDQFRNRTLPDPRAAPQSAWRAAAWWRQRMTGW